MTTRGRREHTQITGEKPPFGSTIATLAARFLINWKPLTPMVGKTPSQARERENVRVWGRIMLLGEMVVARGIATVEQVVSALQRQRDQGGHLGAHLIAVGILTSLELSALLVDQNDARTALPFCVQTLTRWEQEFGGDHPATARARCNLSQMLLADGQAEEALAASQMAHNALRAAYGDDHAWTKKAAAAVAAAHHAVYGPEAAALARLRAITKQPEPEKV